MVEIELLRVFNWPDEGYYAVHDAAGDTIVSDTEDFGLAEMVALGAEHGVTRWSEATDADRKGYDKRSFVAGQLLLVGWAEAPISRDVVTRSYHQGNRESRPPMVNIKVHDTDLPEGEEFGALVSEFDLDPRLARLSHDELRTLIDKYIESDDDGGVFYAACESNFELAESDAKDQYFPGYNIKVYTEGRSGGWLVVEGLPDVDSWGPDLLTAWHEFEKCCQGLVDDVPRAMAWHVLANSQDQLAERTVTVEVSLTLSDVDLDRLGTDPNTWNLRDLLGLNAESKIHVRKR